MNEFVKNLTFWRVVGLLFLIGAVGYALARVVLAARGKDLDTEFLKNWIEAQRQQQSDTNTTTV